MIVFLGFVLVGVVDMLGLVFGVFLEVLFFILGLVVLFIVGWVGVGVVVGDLIFLILGVGWVEVGVFFNCDEMIVGFIGVFLIVD